MRNARVSHIVFALVLIALGILGFVKGTFAPGLEPVPESLPARQVLAYLCDLIYLACGIGLLWGRIAPLASGVLFAFLLLWLLLLRVPWLFVSLGVDTWWSASSASMFVGSSWILYVAIRRGSQRTFLTGENGARIARALFGLGLIPIGLAHFIYLEATAPLVPAWMQWPVLQLAILTFVVWTPLIIAGTMSAFQWNEFVVSILLTTCAWVVADSYRADVRSTSDLQ